MKKLIAFLLFITILISCNYSHNRMMPMINQQLEVVPENGVVHNTEEYDRIYENEFLEVLKNPLSTFSIDVDGASYSNTRRYILQEGSLPPADAVRLEEFVNYFNYDYAPPQNKDPFSIYTELSDCPWNSENKLLHIGLQGKKLDLGELPKNNLVFLIDVSGSMSSRDKLPLLVSSFKLLVDQLDKDDRIAIVVYAGAAGTVLPSTSCDNKDEIFQALDKLESGGSTAGGEGLKLAYKIATKNFIENGNNRILLATDGDFNVGLSSDAAMTRLIEKQRETGIFLSVLGFGTGNLKDSKMEKIADNGNGNYYYIDNLFEAKKVLVTEMGGTLNAIAKDVKIQMEFNPAKVYKYRLLGYENRLLNAEDFEDDAKDAGELGAGHSVTAVYEIIPKSKDESKIDKIDYNYQTTGISKEAYKSSEIGKVKFRYKKPSEDVSALITHPIIEDQVNFEDTSENFRFSASVIEFGLLLKNSNFKANADYDQVIKLAEGAKENDKEGYRSEFIKLVKATKTLDRKKAED